GAALSGRAEDRIDRARRGAALSGRAEDRIDRARRGAARSGRAEDRIDRARRGAARSGRAEDAVTRESDGAARPVGDRDVVADVGCAIGEAESVALMGPSGCGKTTLLQMIGLLDRPTGGKIVLRGCDVWREPAAIRAEMRLSWLGFVFQQNNLIPHLS